MILFKMTVHLLIKRLSIIGSRFLMPLIAYLYNLSYTCFTLKQGSDKNEYRKEKSINCWCNWTSRE